MEIIKKLSIKILNLWGKKLSKIKQQNVQKQIKPLYEKVVNIFNKSKN